MPEDHRQMSDFRSILEMTPSEHCMVEPFMESQGDLRIQKIGPHYRAFRRIGGARGSRKGLRCWRRLSSTFPSIFFMGFMDFHGVCTVFPWFFRGLFMAFRQFSSTFEPSHAQASRAIRRRTPARPSWMRSSVLSVPLINPNDHETRENGSLHGHFAPCPTSFPTLFMDLSPPLPLLRVYICKAI